MNYQAAVLEFLERLGFLVERKETAQGFLNTIDITGGVIRYSTNATAADLLHEAGHLAILPGCYRALATANLDDLSALMFEESMQLDPESPLMRALLQSSDVEATAWAWAAGIHLGLPPEAIIEDESYDGEGASIRDCLLANQYLGINGLRAAGFCRSNWEEGEKFPVLTRWLQEDFARPAPVVQAPKVMA